MTTLRLARVLTVSLSTTLAAQVLPFVELHKDTFPVEGARATAITAGDFDRDGDVDLMLSAPRPGFGHALFYLVNYAGRYRDESFRVPTVGSVAVRIAAGDVDGDGDLDLVLAVNRGKDLLLRNDGSGSFADDTMGNLDVDGGATTDAVLADLDGDRDLDLLLGSAWRSSGFARIALNDGTGRFTDPPNPRLPDYTTSLTVDDCDGDGDLDLLALVQGSVRLLLNNGSAVFTDATAGRVPALAAPPARVLAVDIDRDGDRDVALAVRRVDGVGGGLSLWVNDGSGRYADESTQRAGTTTDNGSELLVLDVDGDGDHDLLASNQPPFLAATDGVDRLWINDGRGFFADRAAQFGYADPVVPMGPGTAVDMNGDGLPDVVLAGSIERSWAWINVRGRRLWLVNPRGYPEDSDSNQAAAAGDVDGDGDDDVIRTTPLSLWLNDGEGRLRSDDGGRLPAVSEYVWAVALADFDGDGDLDLLLGDGPLLVNDGRGTFRPAGAGRLPLSDGMITRGLAVGDVDGDGDLDLVLAKQHGIKRLWLNDGSGGFTDVSATHFGTVQQTAPHWSVALGDLDGDRDLDLVWGTYDPQVKSGGIAEAWFNDGSGRFARSTTAIPRSLRNTTSVVLADFDGDGDLDLFRAALAWCLNPPPETCQVFFNDGTGNFTEAAAGMVPIVAEEVTRARAVDVDGDGDQDVALAIAVALYGCGGLDPQNRVLLNDGSGRFTDGTSFVMPVQADLSTDVVALDVEGDGDADLLFVNDTYGSGSYEFARDRLYSNLHTQLASPDRPVIGGFYSLDFSAVRTPQPARVVAATLLGQRRVDLPLPPFGRLRVDPLGAVALPAVVLSPRGQGSLSLRVPLVPALRGQELLAQAIVLDPAAPLAARLTGVTRDLIE